ncbi:MAG: acyl-CoA dehydrogenase family protein [Xanthobacteraceae bacterium]|nr:acyl-CoA dehydrogenase family protein [Xanthobacteraceae bacterium]
MDCNFTHEQLMLRETARKLMQRVATPDYIRKLDRERLYPYELYEAWAEAGLFRLPFPEEYGGLGSNIVDMAIIAEELACPSADLVMAYGGSMFCGLNLLRNGTDAQKQYFLPKLLAGEIRMTISISEPDAGSDIGAMRTTARRDGDHYVISGQKIWQTGAGAKNNFINVYAKTDPKAHYRNGMSLFLVDGSSPGLDIRKLDMLGRRSVGTCELTFNDVHVPADHLVGGENKGWNCILSGLQSERVFAAACDCGSARGVFELALNYASERKQFGRAIGTFQSIAHMLADMQTEIEAAWALTLRAASLVASGKDALREITMAKLFASETYVKAANNGMQIFGGFGYSMEFDMQRHYRDARAATIAAGTSQIQRNILAGLMGLKV